VLFKANVPLTTSPASVIVPVQVIEPVPGLEHPLGSPPLLELASTNASVAIAVVLSPTVWVGAVGVPVNAGDAKGANAPAVMDAFTKASVETSVVLSPVVCVVAVVPEGSAEAADRDAADPFVLWLNVGKLVKLAALNTGAVLKVGTAPLLVKLPNTE
jgi:hypothetical protein